MSITTVTELWRMSATELAEAIRSGQASSREVVEAHLRRIEQVNLAVNASPVVLAEQALEAAQETHRAVAGGGDLPPLHGVPCTVKGNIDLAGTPSRHPELHDPAVAATGLGRVPADAPADPRPVCTGLPFAVGADLTTPEVAGIIATMPMVLAVSLLGLPAIALPVGIAAGLPQSVQVIGPRYREDLCLDAAAAIENRVGILTPIDPR